MRHTPETKKKLSEMRKGPKNPFYGKKHTEEFRQAQAERTRSFNSKRQYEVAPQSITIPCGTVASYLAGMIDADGSIRFKKGRPFVSIYNTSTALMEWLMKTLKHGCISNGNMGREQVRAWTISAARDVHALIKVIYPHLIVKRGDADAALAFLSEKYEWAR